MLLICKKRNQSVLWQVGSKLEHSNNQLKKMKETANHTLWKIN